ncbi:MAG: YaeQ family protein [Polyangiaceae bacterium]
MALGATIYHFEIALSDVDRSVYESLDLRIARHPSEGMRYMLTRTLAYCLSYEEGIAFSKGGLSSAEEPPVAIHDPTGIFLAWIDVGAPSAERLHKAAKAARRVQIYTHVEMQMLRKEALNKPIHRMNEIDVFRFTPEFLAALEEKISRNTTLEITRNDGQLYVAVGGVTLETPIAKASLSSE